MMSNHETHEMTRKKSTVTGARLSQTQPQHASLFTRAAVGASHTAALLLLLAIMALKPFAICAETVSILLASNASSRVEFGANQLSLALTEAGLTIVTESKDATNKSNHLIVVAHPDSNLATIQKLVSTGLLKIDLKTLAPEGFVLGSWGHGKIIAVVSLDDSGLLYGCLELAKRIRESHKLPDDFQLIDKPAMTLRGTCVGMQKTYILPGRKVYEYPYTPELFPWFYDKALWREYLDSLVANRMNTLYLWNGHPFASLVRLKDYPDAVEVPEDVFAKNVEMFRWLATECDKRGIWLVQMFYNIFLPKPLAEKHGVSTQLSAPTPLASDYTRKSIAEFVKQYPNVGLMVCLGEALQGTANQIEWCTNTILPGVLDGMKAAGLKEQPPVVIRTHAMDANAIIPACFQVYSNLFTETKYNGESLTTWEPRGKGQATHLAMAKLGPHLVNIHILSNLEPFRYGDQQFIKKSVRASRDRLGASGIHLYPLSYWNWPYSPDIADPPLKQWERDWIWFEAWARYAWNPDVPAKEDRAYWIARLAEHYGNTNAAESILDAYNTAGEVAPRLIRRFGITEGNRQTLSLGMTLDQLVNPMKYGAIEDLWLSQAPPGERLDEFVRKEWNHEPHVGETPESIIADVLNESSNAYSHVDIVETLVTKNHDEFERLLNDIRCIEVMARFYAAKTKAAEFVLQYAYSKDEKDMRNAAEFLGASFNEYRLLAGLTEETYHYANSMQTSQRKIPVRGGENGVGTNFLWSQLLPLYKKELEDFQAKLTELKQGKSQRAGPEIGAPIQPLPAAKFKLIGTNAETYEVKIRAQPFRDRKYAITELAPELNGLTGIRFSNEAAKNGRYEPIEFEVTEPVQVLVGYFSDTRDLWLQVPKLEFAAQAGDRGGLETVIEHAATIEECPGVDVHAFRYGLGRQKLELIGKGSFVVLGVVPQSAKLVKRDAGKGAK
jgi:hypothetical protein